MNTVIIRITMIPPKIIDNNNIINNTNIDNVIVIGIVNDTKDIHINSNINIDDISNINIIF